MFHSGGFQTGVDSSSALLSGALLLLLADRMKKKRKWTSYRQGNNNKQEKENPRDCCFFLADSTIFCNNKKRIIFSGQHTCLLGGQTTISRVYKHTFNGWWRRFFINYNLFSSRDIFENKRPYHKIYEMKQKSID